MNINFKTKLGDFLSSCLITILFLLGNSIVPWQAAIAQQSIDLAWAYEQALLKNSQLQSYPYHLRIAEAEKVHAAIKPSAALSAEVENVLGTDSYSAFSNAEYSLTLSQTIEMGDKLLSRVGVVDAQSQAVEADYQVKRLDVLAETSRRYYQVLRLQDMLSVIDKRILREQEALTVIKRRAQAGAVGQADVSKMILRLAHSKAKQQQISEELKLAKTRLSAMWMSEADFSIAKGDLTTWPDLPDSEMLSVAIKTSPHYLSRLAYQRVTESKLQLAKANGVNNIELGVGVRHFEDSNDHALLFSISSPLTFKNPNRGRITAAHAENELARTQSELSQVELKLELAEIHQRMLANTRHVSTIKELLLPAAHALLVDTEKGYQKGQYSVLQWVDAQSELFTLEHLLLELQTTIYLQLLELERVTGQSLTATPSSTSE